MVLVVCMFIHPGGWIIKNWIFQEVIILNIGVAWASRLMVLAGALKDLNGKYLVKGKQKEAGGYGASLKEDYRFFYGAGVGMAGRGEAIPLESNYCEIDPNVVDKFGIPVLRFNVKWSEHEIKQAKHMKETFKEIMHNMGAVITYGGDDDARK